MYTCIEEGFFGCNIYYKNTLDAKYYSNFIIENLNTFFFLFFS